LLLAMTFSILIRSEPHSSTPTVVFAQVKVFDSNIGAVHEDDLPCVATLVYLVVLSVLKVD
jgi:hypothetical protein